MEELIKEIESCTVCSSFFLHEPRPVVSISASARLLIIGQAPGRKVHESGIPWDDASGRQLRKWMNVTDEQFYNEDIFAIIPMGFCYPGKGTSGDLPPRKECAPQWRKPLFDLMPDLELIILIGMYAQNYYLGDQAKRRLTETVNHYPEYLPKYLVLPHPSPRNNIWLKQNPWFEKTNLPALKERIHLLLNE